MHRCHTGTQMPSFHNPFSTPRLLLCALAIAVSILFGCTEPPPPVNVVTVSVAADLRNHWEHLLENHPLPHGYRTAQSVSSERAVTKGSVALARSLWSGDPPPASALVLSRTPYAPFVPLHDLRAGVTAEEVAAGVVPALPLTDILPPKRALPVDGRYVGDDGYPLVEQVYLAAATDDPKLRAWLAGIDPAPMPEPVVWISAVGDMMLERGISHALLSGEDGIRRTFADTLPVLQAADILLGNLEGAVSRRGVPADKSYTFRFPPEVLEPLRSVGFDYLSVTNNHAYDYGEIGFVDTLDFLAGAGIATSGAGRSPAEARRLWRTTVHGQEVHILSLGAYPRERNGFDGLHQASVTQDRPGILWATEELVSKLPAMLSEDAFTVVMVHGGTEWAERPNQDQQGLYRRLAAAGVDLVVGSHPHVVQGLEGYNGSLIAYSLGNFLFNGMQQTRFGEESVILTVGVAEGAIRYVEPTPVQIHGPRISLDQSGAILQRLSARTEELNPSSSLRLPR